MCLAIKNQKQDDPQIILKELIHNYVYRIQQEKISYNSTVSLSLFPIEVYGIVSIHLS